MSWNILVQLESFKELGSEDFIRLEEDQRVCKKVYS